MSYKIPVRMGTLAIGAGLAMLFAVACLAAPVQPGTVEVVLSPPAPATTQAPGTAAPSAEPATPVDLPKEPKEVQAIRLATSPSAAVQAYAEAIKVNDTNPAVYDTYIRRMIGFGLVEILGAPAQALVKLDPNNGLGWAVLGFSLARQGDMPAAFDDAVKAANASPKDPFVLQFAGQLAGWYSHQAGQGGLPPSILQEVLKLRELAAQPAYIQGYTAASNAVQGPTPAAAGTAAATTQTPQPARAAPGVDGTYSNYTTQPMPPADTGNYYSYTDYPSYYSNNYYSDSSLPANYSTYDQGYYMPYSSPYYGGFGGFGLGSSFVMGSPLFFGHGRFFNHAMEEALERGTKTTSPLFFNSNRGASLAQQRAQAATGSPAKSPIVTASGRVNSTAMVGQPGQTPAFSTFRGSSGRWMTMSTGALAPGTKFRASSAGAAVPRAMFTAPASSFRAAPAHFSAPRSFGGGAAHFSSGGGGAAHFSGGGGMHSSGGGGHGGGGRR